MIDADLKFSGLSFGFDTLCVFVETAGGFLVIELGPINRCLAFGFVHEILSPIQICARRCFVVLHDSVRSKKVIHHVNREWQSDNEAKRNASASCNVSSNAYALVSLNNSFFKTLHILGRGDFTAFKRVNSVH